LIYYFSGTARWAKVHKPDDKYKNYTIDLYMDEKSKKAYKNSKLQLKDRTDPDGEHFVTLRMPSVRMVKGEPVEVKPEVLDKDGNPTKDNIGNGSEVTCKVEIYEFDGKVGHRLLAVRADKLVEFKDKNQVSEDTPVEVPF
jgi:hypothetical protein